VMGQPTSAAQMGGTVRFGFDPSDLHLIGEPA